MQPDDIIDTRKLTQYLEQYKQQIKSEISQLETSWTDLTLVNSWVVYSGSYVTGQYRRDKNGMVHLRGLIKSGTTGLIATLPEGFRPAQKELVATSTFSNVYGRLDIETNGQIIGVTYSASWLSLFNIHFLAEQ